MDKVDFKSSYMDESALLNIDLKYLESFQFFKVLYLALGKARPQLNPICPEADVLCILNSSYKQFLNIKENLKLGVF
jgi:hypothetical protein